VSDRVTALFTTSFHPPSRGAAIFIRHLSLQTRAFFVNFLIGGCGSGAYKWRACFPAFVSGFYCKKQEK